MVSSSRMIQAQSNQRLDFDRCRVLLFDPRTRARRSTAASLQRMGFHRIHLSMDFQDLCHVAAQGEFDLLVSETGRAGGNACEMVKRLRHSTFGTDPFTAIVMTAAEPEAALIKLAVKAGSDQILRWPFSD